MNGFERIKTMEKEINNPFLSQIVEFLLTRQDLEQSYLKEEKNLNKMLDFIEYKALSMCENDKKNLPNNRGKYASIVLDNNRVFTWAILYFTFSDEKLGMDKITNMKITSNITKSKTPVKAKVVESKSKKEEQNEQISLFS